MNLKNINKTINFLNLSLNAGALNNHEARFIKNVIRRLKKEAAAIHERNVNNENNKDQSI